MVARALSKCDPADIQRLKITHHPSPNFGPRKGDARPELVVLHYTAMKDCAGALRALCSKAVEVSAHYLIGRDGAVFQLVDEEMRAWHAGAGSWGGAGDVNSRSIGIELDNDGYSPFSAPLMTSLEELLQGVLGRWKIESKAVIAHSDMAPGRKIDPGTRFDWQRLARQGLAVWPENQARDVDEDTFFAALEAYGYPPEAERDRVLASFRSRFSRGVEGAVTPSEVGVALDLARRFPFDVAGSGA